MMEAARTAEQLRAASMKNSKKDTRQLVETTLRWHFSGHELHDLVSASRTFPLTARVDLQLALEKLIPGGADAELFGVHRQYDHTTLAFPSLIGNVHDPAIIAPMQYEE